MKVILKSHLKKVGKKYDVVDVSDGFAINYLIPNRLAEPATAQSLKFLEKVREKAHIGVEKDEAYRSELIEKTNGLSLILVKPANDQGHLFARVHDDEVRKLLEDKVGEEVPKDLIAIDEHIKEIGEYDIKLSDGEHEGLLRLTVKAE